MALSNLRVLSQTLRKHSVVLSFVRNHWNKDYKPGPYPKTQEERLAAAKKYGILPEEYEPMPDDGCGKGDYPAIPTLSDECKDPYYPYDYPDMKRNFNEPIHYDAEIIGEDRLNVSLRHKFSLPVQFMQFASVVALAAVLCWFFEDKRMFIGQIPKQYPYQGKTHYKFEPVE